MTPYKSSLLNDAMALPNINNGNPLRHSDDLCRRQIVILLEVVNDAAPWHKLRLYHYPDNFCKK